MQRTLLFVALAVAACHSPSVPMLGAERTDLVVDGTAYAVRHTETRAEAVRTSFAHDPDTREMLILASRAITAATGCGIIAGTLYGDRVMAEALLDCPGTIPAVLEPRLSYRLP